ncbi:MAG: STAS domain-containing protein [Methylobacter sp.]
MAINNENDLIGFDPLAWMVSESEINEGATDNECGDSYKEQEESQLINDNFDALDEYSDDLMQNIEENASIETDVANDVEFDSDNVLVEDEINEDIDNSEFEEAQMQDTDGLDVTSQSFAADEEIENSQIDLDAVLSIQHVVELHEKLKKVLSIYDEIEINASDVSSIDTSTLQLLVSLKKDAPKLQKKVTIIYPSPRFVESAKLLGLSDVLEVYDA